MARLPHRCVMISVCLAGALLLLPLCLGVEDDQYNLDYESTGTPEYDYNSTIEFSFFINASSEDLEKFLMGRETETETKGEKETVGGGHEEKPTEPTIFDTDQKSRKKKRRWTDNLNVRHVDIQYRQTHMLMHSQSSSKNNIGSMTNHDNTPLASCK
ncbi:hypothetical protein cypCar_00029095 [Cyprinus carpio]|nr:hypothetical protein cypCar_00029095 [Cyprinus carpio]